MGASRGTDTAAPGARLPVTAARAAEYAPGAESGTDPAGGVPASAKRKQGTRSELMGFYVNWDEASYRSLATNIDDLTVLMPEWYHVNANGRVRVANAQKQQRAMRLIKARRPDLRVMPIVNNFGGSDDPKAIARVLAKPALRRRMAADIVRTMTRNRFQGVNIDFEGVPRSSRAHLVAFMRELYPRAKKAGLEVSIDVFADSRTYDYKGLARYSDYLIPMMYDQHWKTSPPGPISAQSWYDAKLAKLFRQVPPKKVVIALGSWTYDWRTGHRRAKAHTYRSALALARARKAPIKLDAKSLNPTFAYRFGAVHHRVWLLDAVTMYNQVKSVSDSRPRGYAVWRLGAEDPDVWRVLPKRDRLDEKAARSLTHGKRRITYDRRRGLIVGQWLKP